MLTVQHPLFTGLDRDLQTKLHGQHLAQSVVLKAIQGFVNNPESNKPLILSFHGWSGTGKNFVARIITDNLYRDGVKSECVRLFIAPFHFPHARLVETYKVKTRRAFQSWSLSVCAWDMLAVLLWPRLLSQGFRLCVMVQGMNDNKHWLEVCLKSNIQILIWKAFWNLELVQTGHGCRCDPSRCISAQPHKRISK